MKNENINDFLSHYDKEVFNTAQILRKIILQNLPDVQEQIDLPAKMIAYCYGKKYIEMVCTLFPSKKGLKLGFYDGANFPDPDNLLKGKGKTSRYIEIKSEKDLQIPAITTLVKEAFRRYKIRNIKS